MTTATAPTAGRLPEDACGKAPANSVRACVSSAVGGGRPVFAVFGGYCADGYSRGAQPRRRPVRGSRATICSKTLMASRAAPSGSTPRAVGIAAPAAVVWPWRAQMGPDPRGGAYTYDWIENLLGLGMHSVDRVLPEFQHPEVGDTIALGANQVRIERVDPGEVLAWRSEDGNWVWSFVIEDRGGGTRL